MGRVTITADEILGQGGGEMLVLAHAELGTCNLQLTPYNLMNMKQFPPCCLVTDTLSKQKTTACFFGLPVSATN